MADAPGGDERVLRLRFIGDFADPNAGLDRLEQRAARGIGLGGQGATTGGTVQADPHGVITSDPGGGLGGQAGAGTGGARVNQQIIDAIDRARQRERRAAERAADAEERRARVLEGALVRYRQIGAQAGVYLYGPTSGGLPVGMGGGGGGGAGGAQIVPGTPGAPGAPGPGGAPGQGMPFQWVTPGQQPGQPPQPQPNPNNPPPNPNNPNQPGWGLALGRLQRLATVGYLAQTAFQFQQQNAQYHADTLLAGRDQRAILDAQLRYRDQLLSTPFSGQIVGFLADSDRMERTQLENSIRGSELQDRVTEAQERAGNERLELRERGERAGVRGFAQRRLGAQQQFDQTLRESRARQKSITGPQLAVLENEYQQIALTDAGRAALNGMEGPDFDATRARLRSILAQRAAISQAGERNIAADTAAAGQVRTRQLADIQFDESMLGQEIRDRGTDAIGIQQDRAAGRDIYTSQRSARNRARGRQFAKRVQETGDEDTAFSEWLASGREGQNEDFEHKRDIGIKMIGLKGQAQSARFAGARDSLMSNLAGQFAGMQANRLATQDQGREVQGATFERDFAQMARTIADAVHGLTQMNRANYGQASINRLLLGGDTRQAGIEGIELQRRQDLDNAGNGIMGWLRRGGINQRANSQIDLFTKKFDLNEKYEIQRLESQRDQMQLRAETKEKSATAKGIEDNATLQSKQAMEEASNIDQTKAGGKEAYDRARKRARLALQTGIATEQNYLRELELQAFGRPESGQGIGKGGIGAGNQNYPLGQERLGPGIKAVKDAIDALTKQLMGVN